MNNDKGKVITARGLVSPDTLNKVLMHEHMHSDAFDWRKEMFITEERPTSWERKQYLLDHAAPLLAQCVKKHGSNAYVDATMPPWRAWPTVYCEISELTGMNIVICTGFYREMEVGAYWVKTDREAIWPFVREASIEGIHDTDIRAGAIKLGTSGPAITEAEAKALRAGARAQKATGVHITTHCTRLGGETSQLTIIDSEGVDLSRVVIGHTASHLMLPPYRKTIKDWMKRGAIFLPTNMGIKEEEAHRWRPLAEAIIEFFDEGFGDRIVLGLDSGFGAESGDFGPLAYIPPDPFTHIFTHTLPEFRAMGVSDEMIDVMMTDNPRRILPVQ